MKKSTKNKAKKILKKSLIAFLVIYYWIWMLYTTQPATDSNTYKQEVFIQDFEISYAYHRGNDRINIISNDNSYILVANWRNKNKTDSFIKELLTENDEVSITVWKHTSPTIPSFIKNGFNVLQIVDIRTENNIYFNIADYNNSQAIERICGVIGGAFLTLVILIFNNLEFVSKMLGKIKSGKNKK